MVQETGRRTSQELTATRAALGAIRRARRELMIVDTWKHFPKDPEFYNIARDLMLAEAVLVKYQRTGRPVKERD